MRYALRSLVAAAGVLVFAGAGLWIARDPAPSDRDYPLSKSRHRVVRSPAVAHKKVLTGRSVRGHRLSAEGVGNPLSGHRILVVGCIHGNECAGIPVARDLMSDRPMHQAQLVVIPDLNPDGRASGTRQNARGVDLNRNFAWRWKPIGAPGSLFYSGPRPLSEPESRFAHRLVRRIHPSVGIWFHQHLAVVDRSGGNVQIERRYARLVGLPLRRLTRYPGSATGWENHRIGKGTAFVVELPAGRLGLKGVERFSDGIRTLARSLR
jgi:murein peptide amidase A